MASFFGRPNFNPSTSSLKAVDSLPDNPVNGQTVVDTSSGTPIIKTYDATTGQFVEVGGSEQIEIGSIVPSDTTKIWLDDANNVYKIYRNDTWITIGGSGSGSSTLTGLSDVPDSYIGQAGKVLKVNSTEDGVEFAVDSGGSVSDTVSQVTKLGVMASIDTPYNVAITIPQTTDFKRRPLEVLQFIAGTQNVITTETAFDNADNTDFQTDDQLVFDGTMHLKTSYSDAMTDSGTLGVGKKFSVNLDLNKFKKIEKLRIPSVTEREMDKYGVSWFKFDEVSGDVTDSKGTAVGTVTGSTRVTGWDGVGNAISFNGTNDYVLFNQKVIPENSNFSIRFKINPTSIDTTNGNFVFMNRNSTLTTAQGFSFLISPTQLIFAQSNGASFKNHIADYSLSTSSWTDILITFNNSVSMDGVKIYINDMNTPLLVSSVDFIQSTASANLILGKRFDNETRYFYGQLDNLEVYNDVFNPNPDKTLISSNGGYKKYDTATSTWTTVTSTTPTETDFTTNGMDDITLTSTELDSLANTDGVIGVETYTPIATTMNMNLNHTSIPHNKIIIPTGDINILNVSSIDSFILNATASGQGIVKAVVSFDQGTTWSAWDNTTATWAIVPLTATDVGNSGMTPAILNAVTSVNWNSLRGTSNTVRFAYFLSMEASTDAANTDSLVMQVDMQGKWKHYKSADWEYGSNTLLTVSLYDNGDYKINY